IEQQSAFFAEKKIKERFFVVGASGLAKDIKVPVVFMDLPFLVLHAFGTSCHPFLWKDAGADVAAVRLRQFRPGDLGGRGDDQSGSKEKRKGISHCNSQVTKI